MMNTLTPAVTVTAIESRDAFAAERTTWQRLFTQLPEPSFFQTWEWLDLQWKHFGERQEITVYRVAAGDQTLGYVPLTVVEEATKMGSVKMLTFPLDDWGTRYGPVGPNPQQLFQATLSHLRESPRRWQLMDLRWIAESQVDDICAALDAEQYQHNRETWTDVYHVDCRQEVWQDQPLNGETPWEKYRDSLNGKFKRDIRRACKRLSEFGEVTLDRWISTPGSHANWPMYNEIVRLARDTWQAATERGTTMCHETVDGFLRDAHATACQLGMVDMSVLRVGEVPAAFAYDYICQNRVFGLRFGFAPEFLRASPGNVLIHKFLEDSFQRQHDSVSLGAHDYGYKHRWASRSEQNWRVLHYPTTELRSQLLRFKRWISG